MLIGSVYVYTMKFKINNSNYLEIEPTKDFFKEAVFEIEHGLETASTW